MIIDAREPDSPRGTVFNADTGERIPYVYWCNLETGEYRRYVTDAEGKFIIDYGRPIGMRVRKAHGRCRLRFEPRRDDVRPDAVASEGK